MSSNLSQQGNLLVLQKKKERKPWLWHVFWETNCCQISFSGGESQPSLALNPWSDPFSLLDRTKDIIRDQVHFIFVWYPWCTTNIFADNQLPQKTDQVVFCPLTDRQILAYRHLLEMEALQNLIHRDDPCTCGSRKLWALGLLCQNFQKSNTMHFAGGNPVVIPSSQETSSGICRSSLSFLTTLAWSYQVSNLNLLDQLHGLMSRRPERLPWAGTTIPPCWDSSDRQFVDRQEPRIGGNCFPRRKYTEIWHCHDATPILWKMGCEFQNQISPTNIDDII